MEIIHQIVKEITTDKRILELVSKMQPEDLQPDLLSHCKLELYKREKKEPGLIEQLYNRNELFAWFSTAVKLQMTGTESTFYIKYRKKRMVYSDEIVSAKSSTYDFDEARLNKLNPAQQEAVKFIYERIESRKRKRGTNQPVQKSGGAAFKIIRLEKKLEEIKEIKTLIEAFSSLQNFCMDYVRKYYRAQAKWVERNRGKDHSEVLADLECELSKTIEEKELLTKYLSDTQNKIAERLEKKITQTKKERITSIKTGSRNKTQTYLLAYGGTIGQQVLGDAVEAREEKGNTIP